MLIMMIRIFNFELTFDLYLAGDGSKKIKGCWDSIHVVEVSERGSGGRQAHYKLTSTAMLWLQVCTNPPPVINQI